MRIPSGCSKLETPVIVDKVKGLIFGAILGDSLGLATEGLSRAEIDRIYGKGPIRFGMDEVGAPFIRDQYRSQFDENDFGDDAEQILLVIETLLENNGYFHVKDFAARFRTYYDQGIKDIVKPPIGINATTKAVLENSTFQTNPKGAAVEVWKTKNGLRGTNGALVRAPLLGVLKFWDGMSVIENTIDCCKTTHPDPICLIACVIASTLVARLLRGQDLEIGPKDIANIPLTPTASTDNTPPFFVDMLDIDIRLQALVQNVVETNKPMLTTSQNDLLIITPESDMTQIENYYHQILDYATASSITNLYLDDYDQNGAFKCLGASIYCLTRAVPPQRETEYFKNIIMDVVMQGGEADTNATVVGAMLGARFGYSQLPTEWVVGLKRWEWLEDRIDEFCALL